MSIIPIQSKNSKERDFTRLIEENKTRFYKTAKSLLKNDDDVYDVLQESLISMYQNYDKIKEKKFFSTWATRIIINKCYDLLRKTKNNLISIDEKNENLLQLSKLDKYSFDSDLINKAICSLSDNLKLITILYYYNDFSVKEISQICNIPEGTVKSRLSKAREILRQKLGKEMI